MVKTILQVFLVALVIGVVAEMIRSVPDPDLWQRSSSGWIVGVAGGVAAFLVVSRRDRQRRESQQ